MYHGTGAQGSRWLKDSAVKKKGVLARNLLRKVVLLCERPLKDVIWERF